MTDQQRPSTPIDAIADAWVDTLAEQVPTLATYIGRDHFNDRFGDLSPAGFEALADKARQTRAPWPPQNLSTTSTASPSSTCCGTLTWISNSTKPGGTCATSTSSPHRLKRSVLCSI